MAFKMGKKLQFHLNFAFLTDVELIKQKNIPKERAQFRFAAEKYLNPIWKKMAKKSNDTLEPFKSRKFKE
jgi:hypothetical protein